MSVLVSAIIDKVARELLDPNNLKWPRAELLGWLNDGLRQIALQQPTATNTVTSVKLVAGTRQALPADGWMVLSVNRNMGTAGNTPGRAIRVISRELLDGFNPNWHSDVSASVVKHFLTDEQDQTAFWVYPPSDGTGYVELNYSRQIANLLETNTLPVFELYQQVLEDYIMYRAYTKNASYARPDLAAGYLQTFSAALGAKDASEKENKPEQELLPRDPGVAGRST